MLERVYRQRLESDLAQWQAAGVVPAATADAIRHTLPPMPTGINIATVVAIVGGLLVGAAFLAFVAANWSEIPRATRFAILLAGIAGAYGIGALFAHTGRFVLADLSATIGSIVFGAAIALVGQMYHLGGDFAGGLFLWAAGALVAAILTGSWGALAVALTVGCIWSGVSVYDDTAVPHLPFVAFWLICVALALWWKAPVARHLVAIAAVAWWIDTATAIGGRLFRYDPTTTIIVGGALLMGGGLALASQARDSVRALGLTLSTYGAFAFAIALGWTASGIFGAVPDLPPWIFACGVAGAVLAGIGAAISRRPGPAVAGIAIAFALVVISGWGRSDGTEPWPMYALSLGAALSLVVSGMLDGVRPRIVAGWIGLAAIIAAITWAVEGSLLRRSMFLAVAGFAMFALATLLGRLLPREAER